jgi:hypothetical protein
VGGLASLHHALRLPAHALVVVTRLDTRNEEADGEVRKKGVSVSSRSR